MTNSSAAVPDGKDEDSLRPIEVAAILRVLVNTLRWWRQQGDGPRFFKIGRHLLTTIGELRVRIGLQKETDSVGS